MRLLHSSVLPSLLLMLLVLPTATAQEPPPTTTPEFILQFRTGGDPVSQCRRFFAVDGDTNSIVDEAGTFCLVLDPADQSNLLVSYATKNDWLLAETAAWFGTTVDDLPVNRDGEPQLRDFDYTTDNGNNIEDALTTTSFVLPLADVAGIEGDDNGGDIPFATEGGCTAAGQQVTLFGVASADLVRAIINDDGEDEEEEAIGWADGLVPADPDDDLWALYNFTLECVAAVTEAPTFAPVVATPFPTFAPVPTTPFPTFPPVPPPVNPNLLADGAMCDDSLDCQSGGCSAAGFCLASLGAACADSSDCSSDACIQGVCGVCPAFGPTSILTQDLVERSRVAGLLSDRLAAGPFTSTPVVLEFGNVYNQGTSDVSMVAKVEGVCYGIFAATETAELTSFGTLPLEAFQQTCDVHERAYHAYFADERQLFELRLAQCASTCVSPALEASLDFTNTPIQSISLDQNACPIVLAGHGLGGAAAVVGSMVLLDLSPQVITLGAPRTIAANCPLMRRLVSSEHYRHVALGFVESYNTFLFDPIPQLGESGPLVHYGTPILLDVAETIVLDLDDDTTRASVYSTNKTEDVHNPSKLSLYNARLSALYSEPCFPVAATDAWENGHWCDRDDLCTSGRCRAFLTLGEDDSVGVCAQKLQAGLACTDNDDCLSGGCNAGICAAAGNGGGNADPSTTPPNNNNGGGNTDPTTPPNNNGGGGTLGNCALCSIGTECQSGVCVTFEIPGGSSSVCAETADGTMSNGCFCFENANEQCTDGRCESDASGVLFLCIAPLGPCQSCDEPSDCVSGVCIDGVCGLQSGTLPDECGGGGGGDEGDGGGDNLPPLPVCDAPACEEDDDCDSGFCRTVGLVSCAYAFSSSGIIHLLRCQTKWVSWSCFPHFTEFDLC